MSDDDRMERAERIRRMREGRRSGPAGDASSEDEGSDEPGESPEGPGDRSDDPDESAGRSGGQPDGSGAAGEGSDDRSDDPDEAAGESDDQSEARGDAAGGSDEKSDHPDDTARGSSGRSPDPDQEPAEADVGTAGAGGEEPSGENGGDSGAGDQDAASAPAERAAEVAANIASDAPGGAGEGDAVSGGAGAGTGGPTGIELPDADQMEAALGAQTQGGGTDTGTGEATPGGADSSESVRVLQFSLEDEEYCIDIDNVEEIVDRGTVTRVPNSPDYVAGVVDLRGRITTILDPKRVLDLEHEDEGTVIVVFDPEKFEDLGAIGWLVDEVRQVVPIAESQINVPPMDEDYIDGIVEPDGDEEFVIWVDPQQAIKGATVTEDGQDGPT